MLIKSEYAIRFEDEIEEERYGDFSTDWIRERVSKPLECILAHSNIEKLDILETR